MIEFHTTLCKNINGTCFEKIQSAFTDWNILGPIIAFYLIIIMFLFFNGLRKVTYGKYGKILLSTKNYSRIFWVTLILGIILITILFIFPIWAYLSLL